MSEHDKERMAWAPSNFEQENPKPADTCHIAMDAGRGIQECEMNGTKTDTITLNLKSGVITAEVGGKKYEGLTGFIQSQRDMLEGFRNTTPNPQLLVEDLKVYDHILADPKSDELADQYLQKKREMKDRGIFPTHMQVAEALGWDIL